MKQLTKAEVEPIYKDRYWLKCHCQELPSGVEWAVFDYAVNEGPSKAAKALQRAVGAFSRAKDVPSQLWSIIVVVSGSNYYSFP